ncbi:MAG: tetraacyldisaccharide 4'-kinase [Bacteroidales bacterium]|nr:tetraacyldisaccharide 4'-kinase [Bacteroidales bacterium]
MKDSPNLILFILLSPLVIIYRIAISIRNFCFDNKILKTKEYKLPIISIGNISVGGTGKTPHTEFILKMLKKEYSVAILSRGYKRKTKGFRIVEQSDSHYDAGDEPLQIKQKFPDVIVSVCESRTAGVDKLLELYPDLNLIILDDAFQHRRISPGLSILLNNYHHPIAKDFLLPLGRLREPRSASHRAHIVIFSKCPANLKPIERRILSQEVDIMPYQYLFFSTLKYHDLRPVFSNEGNEIKISELKDYNVLAFTGIARSSDFADYIETNSASLRHIKYPDHYNYTQKDIMKIQDIYKTLKSKKVIVVTEKDAVRLKSIDFFDEEIKKAVYCIPIEVELICSEEERKQFDNQIFSYVRNNKRYSKLYRNSYSGLS